MTPPAPREVPRRCAPAPAPDAPSFAMPAGACDTHLHVLGPFDRYPLAPTRPYEPAPATLDTLLDYMAVTGVERVVVAHVSAHGLDLSVTSDALQQLGERARGVALLTPEVSDAALARLHDLGYRGVRLSGAYNTGTGIDEATVRRWAARIGPMGWHIATWPGSVDELRVLRTATEGSEVALVLDHLCGHAWRVDGGLSQPGFVELLALLESGRAWLKLSGMYRVIDGGAPWAALQPYARALLAAAPSRLLWASDWPHVGIADAASMPRARQLLDWLPAIGADAALCRRILVENPERLYGFAPVRVDE